MAILHPAKESIRPIAICIIQRENEFLMAQGIDRIARTRLYRPLGGTIEFGEDSSSAIQREFMEELHSGIENLEFVRVIESFFSYENQPVHEIVFVYQGVLADKALYGNENLSYDTDNQHVTVHWKDPRTLNQDEIILPYDLKQILIKNLL